MGYMQEPMAAIASYPTSGYVGLAEQVMAPAYGAGFVEEAVMPSYGYGFNEAYVQEPMAVASYPMSRAAYVDPTLEWEREQALNAQIEAEQWAARADA